MQFDVDEIFFEIPLVCKGVFPNPNPNPPKNVLKNTHEHADKVCMNK